MFGLVGNRLYLLLLVLCLVIIIQKMFSMSFGKYDLTLQLRSLLIQQATPHSCLFLPQQRRSYSSIWISDVTTYYHSIGKKPIETNYYYLTENIESNPKAPKFKVDDWVRITKYKNSFSKGYTENWSRKIFIIDFVLKLILRWIKWMI